MLTVGASLACSGSNANKSTPQPTTAAPPSPSPTATPTACERRLAEAVRYAYGQGYKVWAGLRRAEARVEDSPVLLLEVWGALPDAALEEDWYTRSSWYLADHWPSASERPTWSPAQHRAFLGYYWHAGEEWARKAGQPIPLGRSTLAPLDEALADCLGASPPAPPTPTDCSTAAIATDTRTMLKQMEDASSAFAAKWEDRAPRVAAAARSHAEIARQTGRLADATLAREARQLVASLDEYIDDVFDAHGDAASGRGTNSLALANDLLDYGNSLMNALVSASPCRSGATSGP